MRTLEPERGVQPRRRVPFEAIGQTPLDAPESPIHPAETRPPRASDSVRDSKEVSPPRTMRKQHEEVAVDDATVTSSGRSVQVASPARARVNDSDAISTVPHPTVRAANPERPPAAQPNDARERTSSPRRAPGAEVVPVVTSRRTDVPRVRAQTPQANESASEPVIRIHIGRVDVRAVTQSTPAPAAPRGPRRDLVTLDKYVQQRSGSQS